MSQVATPSAGGAQSLGASHASPGWRTPTNTEEHASSIARSDAIVCGQLEANATAAWRQPRSASGWYVAQSSLDGIQPCAKPCIVAMQLAASNGTDSATQQGSRALQVASAKSEGKLAPAKLPPPPCPPGPLPPSSLPPCPCPPSPWSP